jgi:hypothetical protein
MFDADLSKLPAAIAWQYLISHEMQLIGFEAELSRLEVR